MPGIVVDALLGTGAHGPPDARCGRRDRRDANAARGRCAQSSRSTYRPDSTATTGDPRPTAVAADLTISFGSRQARHARHRAAPAVRSSSWTSGSATSTRRIRLRSSTLRFVRASVPSIESTANKGTRKQVAIVAGWRRDGRRCDPRGDRCAAQWRGAGEAVHGAREHARRCTSACRKRSSRRCATRAAGCSVGPTPSSIGPGLGVTPARRARSSKRVLRTLAGPFVLDADALNAFAGDLESLAALLRRKPAVLTPHPAELARVVALDCRRRARPALGHRASRRARDRMHGPAQGTPPTIVSAPDGTRLVSRARHRRARDRRQRRRARRNDRDAARAGMLERRRCGGVRRVDAWARGRAARRSARHHARRRAWRAARRVESRDVPAHELSGARRAAGGVVERQRDRLRARRGVPRSSGASSGGSAAAASGIGDDGDARAPPARQRARREHRYVDRPRSLPPRLDHRREIGYRAATAALSDLAAMGARRWAFSSRSPCRAVRASARRIRRRHRASAATRRRHEGHRRRHDARRSAVDHLHGRWPRARAADSHRARAPTIACTSPGRLGGPAAARARVGSGRRAARRMARDASQRPVGAHPGSALARRPGARARRSTSPTGSPPTCAHIAAASNVRISVDLDRVPLHRRRRTARMPRAAARSTSSSLRRPSRSTPRVRAHRFGIPLTEIGVVRDGAPGVEFSSAASRSMSTSAGYDHFIVVSALFRTILTILTAVVATIVLGTIVIVAALFGVRDREGGIYHTASERGRD